MSEDSHNRPTILLEVIDRNNFSIGIQMSDMPTLDYALNMLAQAMRNFEFQQGFGMEIQAKEQMMQARKDEALRLSIVGGGRKQ